MSQARLVITAVALEGRSQSEVARTYGVSKGWVSKLVARYRAEGESAFTPRSRRPHSSPNATPPDTVERIVALRRELSAAGMDAGPDTIVWHLARNGGPQVSPATISRLLTRAGLIVPAPPNAPAPPTSGSPPTCRTTHGSRTSPTTGSPTAPTARS